MCYTSYKFQGYCPPVIGFAMGSLGFLTPLDISNPEVHLSNIIYNFSWITLRTRLYGQLVRYKDEKKDFRIKMGSRDDGCLLDSNDYEIDGVSSYRTVLNEFLIQRTYTNMVDLDCYVFDKKITNLIADGMIVATPTGSTAYSCSAGGSMVHPSVPAMLLTAICPHSLSFRPIILSDSALLRVQIPLGSKSQATLICDGREWTTLLPGDSLYVLLYFKIDICINISISNNNSRW